MRRGYSLKFTPEVHTLWFTQCVQRPLLRFQESQDLKWILYCRLAMI